MFQPSIPNTSTLQTGDRDRAARLHGRPGGHLARDRGAQRDVLLAQGEFISLSSNLNFPPKTYLLTDPGDPVVLSARAVLPAGGGALLPEDGPRGDDLRPRPRRRRRARHRRGRRKDTRLTGMAR